MQTAIASTMKNAIAKANGAVMPAMVVMNCSTKTKPTAGAMWVMLCISTEGKERAFARRTCAPSVWEGAFMGACSLSYLSATAWKWASLQPPQGASPGLPEAKAAYWKPAAPLTTAPPQQSATHLRAWERNAAARPAKARRNDRQPTSAKVWKARGRQSGAPG